MIFKRRRKVGPPVDRTRMEMPMFNAAELECHDVKDIEEARARIEALNIRYTTITSRARMET